jgi:hypothetical protein
MPWSLRRYLVGALNLDLLLTDAAAVSLLAGCFVIRPVIRVRVAPTPAFQLSARSFPPAAAITS